MVSGWDRLAKADQETNFYNLENWKFWERQFFSVGIIKVKIWNFSTY